MCVCVCVTCANAHDQRGRDRTWVSDGLDAQLLQQHLPLLLLGLFPQEQDAVRVRVVALGCMRTHRRASGASVLLLHATPYSCSRADADADTHSAYDMGSFVESTTLTASGSPAASGSPPCRPGKASCDAWGSCTRTSPALSACHLLHAQQGPGKTAAVPAAHTPSRREPALMFHSPGSHRFARA